MQQDFHFYGIYVICRGAGLKPELARTIAYASQYVDDAKHENAIKFENGGWFHQEMTAHELISRKALDEDTQYRIFSAFHFLPGNAQALPKKEETPKFREKMICIRDSDIAKDLLDQIKKIPESVFFPQAVGIALHTYADTFAHQDFSGLCSGFEDCGIINDADSVEIWVDDINQYVPFEPGERKFSKGLEALGNWFANLTEAIKMGHTQVFTLPDEPYRRWRYRHAYYGWTLERCNWEIYR